MRKTSLVNGEHYHVYNRGVDKRSIFQDRRDVERFFKSMQEFNVIEPVGSIYENSFLLGRPTSKSDRLVNVVAYCLNPNHYHFILEQVSEGGVSEFMKRVGGGYTKYFNNKHKRSGVLFQGKFKSVHIDSNEYLLHLSAYVNLNDKAHQLGRPTSKLVKSSWEEYIDENIKGICDKKIILEQFGSIEEYKVFALDSLESIVQRKSDIKDIDKLLLE